MGGVFGPLMSEYILAAIINHQRKNFQFYDLQKNATWEQGPLMKDLGNFSTLKGKICLIVGLGGIGREGKLLYFQTKKYDNIKFT